jgi:hypothetical protein
MYINIGIRREDIMLTKLSTSLDYSASDKGYTILIDLKKNPLGSTEVPYTIHRLSPLGGMYEAEGGVRVFILFFLFVK